MRRDEPGLLLELARGAGRGRLAGVELAGRNLPEIPADGVTILPQQRHVPVVVERGDRGGAGMAHDLERIVWPFGSVTSSTVRCTMRPRWMSRIVIIPLPLAGIVAVGG